MIDKVTALLKEINTPFKLFAAVTLLFVVGLGFFVYQNEQKIWQFFTHSGHYRLIQIDKLQYEALRLIDDVEAEAIAVHKGDVQSNERETVLAMDKNENRNKKIEGLKTSLFNSGLNNRNEANIMMLRGEVFCADFKSSSKVGKWMDSMNVKYMCRASLPPQAGHFHGYVAVGFKSKPDDLLSVKGRIVLGTSNMVENK